MKQMLVINNNYRLVLLREEVKTWYIFFFFYIEADIIMRMKVFHNFSVLQTVALK